MAQIVYLKLRIAGNIIEGESRKHDLDRENTIECYSFEHGGIFNSGTKFSNIVIQKPFDRSSPFLVKAMKERQNVDRAEFMFFNTDMQGRDVKFYTFLAENGFVNGVHQFNEDDIIGGENCPPLIEKVTFSIKGQLTWTNEIFGNEYRTSVSGNE